jgi:hypothetical protein
MGAVRLCYMCKVNIENSFSTGRYNEGGINKSVLELESGRNFNLTPGKDVRSCLHLVTMRPTFNVPVMES